jgi:hypothetical protein
MDHIATGPTVQRVVARLAKQIVVAYFLKLRSSPVPPPVIRSASSLAHQENHRHHYLGVNTQIPDLIRR